MTIDVRDATIGDVAATLDIYAHHAQHGLGTFDEVPPSLIEFEAKWTDTVRDGLPWLVAVDGGDILGFAYGSKFRPRSAYRYTVEDSVYIAPDAVGRGLGHAALAEVIRRAADRGYRQMIAIIGDSGNHASIRLHEKIGFRRVATLQAVGFKFGRWVDSVLMQLSLGAGDDRLPDR